MTPPEKENELLKLTANWCNTLATAVVTTGTILPAAQFVFEILPDKTEPTLLWGTAGSCLAVGVGIHWFGRWILGGLE